ncbi:hypothetical protein NDK43_27015 [Neobacillus pocheonensis]|uniref:Uncharacterized protein n=1 Tax=Neobacillus pocheonensis TaxID=363869 RepID=A0ABT0WI97_9BACI|nr:hypothetical protein [Neobacillus pocheonensis]
MKDVSLQIFYISNENSVTQRGSFPLRGKTKEVVAYEWFRKIKKEMPFGAELEKVSADGDDITEKVMEIEKAQLG